MIFDSGSSMQKYVSELLQKWNLHPWLWNLLLVATAILIGLLISAVLSLFLKKQTGQEIRFNFGQSLVRHLTTPVAFLVPFFLFNTLIPLLRMDQIFRSRIAKATEIALIIGFAWLLVRFVRVAQDVVRHKVNINQSDNLRQREIITQLIYVRRVVVGIIIILAIGAVLLTFDTLRKIGAGLLTSVGIGGIIIGFAAQRSLANLLAGLQIAFTQPIRIDDEVIVEGEFGRIEELTLTYVVVRIWDNRRLILPINYFIEKPFQNWTRKSTEILGTVYFYVDYNIPVDWVRQEFLKLVENNKLWDRRAAGLAVTDLKTDVMELRGVVSASNSGHAFDLRCQIREQLMKQIAERYPDSLPKTRAFLKEESRKTVEKEQ